MWCVSELMATGEPSEAYSRVKLFRTKDSATEWFEKIKEEYLRFERNNLSEEDVLIENNESVYLYKDEDMFKVHIVVAKVKDDIDEFEMYVD